MHFSLDQSTGKHIETWLTSPKPQVDGGHTEQLKEEDVLTFQSEYREEVILFSLEEVFPTENGTTLMSKNKVEPLSANPYNVQLMPVQERLVFGLNTE